MLRAKYGDSRGVVRESVSKGSVWWNDVWSVEVLSESIVR